MFLSFLLIFVYPLMLLLKHLSEKRIVYVYAIRIFYKLRMALFFKFIKWIFIEHVWVIESILTFTGNFQS